MCLNANTDSLVYKHKPIMKAEQLKVDLIVHGCKS